MSALQSLIALAQQPTPEVPLFRKSDPAIAVPAMLPGKLRLLTDADFPPFSFTGADGRAMGLSVDLALAACEELKISCKVETRSFGELAPALLKSEGDIIVSGIRLNPELLNQFSMTRPYFRSSGRFAVVKSFSGETADKTIMDGKVLGVIGGSVHEAWIKKYFPGTELKSFKSEGDLFAALKGGEVGLIFGDGLHIAFWLAGASSADCCRTLGKSFFDQSFFSHNLVFLARRGDTPIVEAFDAALDRLQDSGVTSKLLQRYFPAVYW